MSEGLSYLTSHLAQNQQFIYGAILGAILSNPGTCAIVLFNLFIKIPGIGLWIASHPDQAKGWADEFDKSIDQQIDKYSSKSEPPKA